MRLGAIRTTIARVKTGWTVAIMSGVIGLTALLAAGSVLLGWLVEERYVRNLDPGVPEIRETGDAVNHDRPDETLRL